MPKKPDDKEQEDPQEPVKTEEVPPGKTRQFQVAPGQHEHLTKAEAKKKGFHWKD